MKRSRKYKAHRPTGNERQAAFDLQGVTHQEAAAPAAADAFWSSADGRYPSLGGHMTRLYGDSQGETCGTCLNYEHGRCVAYSRKVHGWSRSWPACGAFGMTDPKDRAALRGFTMNGDVAEGSIR